MGTMCTEDVDYYLERPFYDDDTHGLFAVLFAGIEIHHLLARKPVRSHQAWSQVAPAPAQERAVRT